MVEYHNPTNPGETHKSKALKLLESFLWISAAVATVYYSNFASSFYERLTSTSMIFALLASIGFIGIFVYMNYYLPLFKKVKVDIRRWEEDAKVQKLIQSATICGILAFIAFNAAIWDVYHILSPIILFVIGLGGISLISLF